MTPCSAVITIAGEEWPCGTHVDRRLIVIGGVRQHLHMLRHSRATDLLRHGVGVDVVARLLTHRSSTTTSQTYIHLDVQDLRAELTRAGVWDTKDPT